MVNPRDISIGVILCALMASACAHVPRAVVNGKIRDAWSQISTKDCLRVRGIGVSPVDAVGPTRRRGLSRQAALVSARYQLLSVIKGVKLEGGVTISQLMEKDSLVREIVNDVVAGGEEVQTEWLADDGVVVTLELKRSKVERLIQKKTQNETDLEARVANDIREINQLNLVVQALVDDHMERKTDDKFIKMGVVNDLIARLGPERVDAATLKRMIEDSIIENHGIADNAVAELCKKLPNIVPDCAQRMKDWGVSK